VVKVGNEHWLDNVPKVVETNHKFTEPVWNQQIYTDRTFPLENRYLNSVLERTYIDVAKSGKRTVMKEEK
jgi:hypothetical protein